MIEIEQTLDEFIVIEKIYTAKQIRVATFLGGPLVAGYLTAENFKAFNEFEKARTAWIITFVFTVVLFGGLFFIPVNTKGSGIIIPIIDSWIAFYLVQHYQGIQMTEHANAGGLTFNWWRVIGIGLLGTVITLVMVFVILMLYSR